MDYQRELGVAKELTIEAGKILMAHFAKKQNVMTKSDGTSVTSADLESNDLIIRGLRKHFPEDGIVSEESKAIEGTRMWYVDPLDGTRSFIEGVDHFAVHIGLCVKGVPAAGVVYRPSTKELYYGDSINGAFKETEGKGKRHLKTTEDETHLVLVSTSITRESDELKKVLRNIRITNVVRISCTGLRMMKIAENEADLFFTSAIKVKSWDICAPHAILRAAGAHFSYLDGREINYDNYISSDDIIVGTKSESQFNSIRGKILL